MSTTPADETMKRYDAPSNTQFSVFLDNRIGKLHELIRIFDHQPAKLVALTVMDASDHAVVRLITTDAAWARQLLERQPLPFSCADVLAIELSREHDLTQMCTNLLQAEISIHYAYPLMVRPHGRPVLALYTDNQVLACQVLLRNGYQLLGEGDLNDTLGPTNPFDSDN